MTFFLVNLGSVVVIVASFHHYALWYVLNRVTESSIFENT